MGKLIFIAIVLWFLTSNYPDTFGFIGTFFSFLWNIIGYVIMFFVNIFSGIIKFFDGSIQWLLPKLGTLLDPVMEAIPDSPIVPFLALFVLGLLFLLLKRPGDDFSAANANMYIKLTHAWCFTAINLGMIVACSGNPLASISLVVDTYAIDVPMTLFNYTEWDEYARMMLGLTLVGGLIISLIFGVFKGLRSFLRTWVGLGFCGVLGYVCMSLRLVLGHWLETELGFIGALLDILLMLLEGFTLIQFFFGIIVFLLPMGVIFAISEMSRERDRKRISEPAKETADSPVSGAFGGGSSGGHESSVFPKTLSINGEQYRLEHAGGDNARYYCPRTGDKVVIRDSDLNLD